MKKLDAETRKDETETNHLLGEISQNAIQNGSVGNSRTFQRSSHTLNVQFLHTFILFLSYIAEFSIFLPSKVEAMQKLLNRIRSQNTL